MAVDHFAGANQGLANLQNTLMNIYQMKRQEKQDAQAATLQGLQVKAAEQGLSEGALRLSGLNAQKNALVGRYKTEGDADPYGRALALESEQKYTAEQGKLQQEQNMAKAKMFMEGYAKFNDGVEGGKIDPDDASKAFRAVLKMADIDMGAAGVDVTFKKGRGGYYSGPITPEALVMMNGQPVPYGAAGTVSKARIVSFGPDGKPVFEFDEHTTYEPVKETTTKPSTREYEEGDTKYTELYDAKGNLTGTKKAPRYKPAPAGGGHGGGQGKPPFGYRFTANGDLEAIPGGPASPDGKQGGKILPASQLESIADMKRVKDVLAEASDDAFLRQVKTGPVAGRRQAVGAKVGLSGDGFVTVQQKLQTAQNIMLKLRSGAAVTESEYERFLKEYPTPNDPPEVFRRKMDNTLAYAETLMDEKLSIYEEGGYRVPQSVKSGGKAAPAPAPKGKPTAPRKIGKYTVEVH